MKIGIVGAENSHCAHIAKSLNVEKDVSGWTQTAKLIPADSAASDLFGVSVAISGAFAVIGAYGNDDCGSNSGSAYIFYRGDSGWTQMAKIVPPSLADDQFGGSVALDGTTMIGGAFGDDTKGSAAGAAYVFSAAVRPGDANYDGKIDGTDLIIWQQNYDPLSAHANTWAMGDWNADGKIDGADLALWRANYSPLGYSVLSFSDPIEMNAVPEPTTLAFLALGLTGLALRKRTKEAHP